MRNLNCPHIAEKIHQYMDGELNAKEEQSLKKHLHQCRDCMKHYQELEKAIALVKSTSHIKAPDHFTANVMKSLPKEKRTVSFNRWIRSHPFFIAASLFILLMSGSLFNSYQADNKFSVTKYDELIVENHTVIVPEGETIKGDIVVRNGDIKVEGKVEGNVTVINGNQYLASAGQVTGEIEEINQLFEWLWYKIKSLPKEIVNVFSE